jgi:hypothetical protein
MEMDPNAFNMFRQAIENFNAEEKIASGIDDLTFLGTYTNMEHRKKTLSDSLEDAVKESTQKY